MEDIKFDDEVVDYENKEEEIQEEEIKQEEKQKAYILYMVTDRVQPGIVRYFRENGVNVSNIYSKIDEVRDVILMQSEPCRLIVADTGLGRFINTRSRKELIDMLGICDENNRITVFYTDNLIKHEYERELGDSELNIDWIKYINTPSIVAQMLSYKEKYILDDFYDTEEIEEVEMSKIKGLKVDTKENIVTIKEYDRYIDNIAIDMMNSDDNLLEEYSIEL